jgi:hypothetical protein
MKIDLDRLLGPVRGSRLRTILTDPTVYRQIGGDMNPVTHGGVFYLPPSDDDDAVDLIVLSNVAETIGESSAATVRDAFWVKTVSVSRKDVNDLVDDPSWRQSLGIEEQDGRWMMGRAVIHDPMTAPWQEIAWIAAMDDGIGRLGWEEDTGDTSGVAIYRYYKLVDFNGKSLESDLLEADKEHAKLRADRKR